MMGGIGEGEPYLYILFCIIFAGGDALEVILLVVTVNEQTKGCISLWARWTKEIHEQKERILNKPKGKQ